MVSYNYKEFIRSVEKFIGNEKKYFFYGENIFQIDFTIEEILKKLGGIEREIIYGWEASVEQLIIKLSTPTLFCKNSVVILKNFESCKKKFRRELVEFIKNYRIEQYFIIVNNGSILYKEIKSDKEGVLDFLLKNTIAVEFVNFSRQEVLNDFIPNNCTKKLNESAKKLLYENSGENLYLLYNELKKLLLYSDKSSEITESDVERCCSIFSSADLKDLFYSIEKGIVDKSLLILNSLFVSGVEPVYISVALYRYIRNQFLWKRISNLKILEVLKELHNLDYKIKTSSDSKYIFESIVIKLCKILGN